MDIPFPMSMVGAGAYDWLEPIAAGDDQRGNVLAALCGGIGEMFREVEQLVRARPGRQPWQQAFDIDACPDFQVQWLGQMVGVRVTPSATPDVQRAQVKAEAGFWRGGVNSMRNAVAATLTGTQKVFLIERSSDAWTISVYTDPAETPSSTVTQNAAMTSKVAGLVLSIATRTIPEVDDGTLTVDAVAGSVTVDNALLPDVT